MKIFTLILATLALVAAPATSQAVSINPDDTVSGIIAADIMTSSSGVFYDWSSLVASDTRDPATSITDDALVTTYAYSLTDYAYVDLGFSTSIYNGAGDDLAFFMTGDPLLMDFNAVVSDDFGNSITISSDTSSYIVVNEFDLLFEDGFQIALNSILIDLDDYGTDVFGANPLTNIRFNFGSEEFGSPGLSLAGGIHTTAAVVPLPLPIVLFGSGLGLLGLFGRRKKS